MNSRVRSSRSAGYLAITVMARRCCYSLKLVTTIEQLYGDFIQKHIGIYMQTLPSAQVRQNIKRVLAHLLLGANECVPYHDFFQLKQIRVETEYGRIPPKWPAGYHHTLFFHATYWKVKICGGPPVVVLILLPESYTHSTLQQDGHITAHDDPTCRHQLSLSCFASTRSRNIFYVIESSLVLFSPFHSDLWHFFGDAVATSDVLDVFDCFYYRNNFTTNARQYSIMNILHTIY